MKTKYSNKTTQFFYKPVGIKGRRHSVAWAILLLSLFSAGFGCKKFLVIPTPNNQLVTASVLSNNESATAAVTGIYTTMWTNSESYNMASNTGLLGDELATTQTSPLSLAFLEYINAMLATNAPNTWQNAYNYIYQANAIISGLQTTSGCSPAVKKQLSGEAYFIRAFWHFYLSDCYGDVPIALTTDFTVTDKLARSPRVQVLQQVITDLKAAQSLLNATYVDASDTLTTTERVRPTQGAAAALLARAYLYLGNYAKDAGQYANADAVATSVINNPLYSLSPLTGANEVFTKNSSEAIWQLQTPQPENVDTYDGYFFILLAAPGTNGYYLQPNLLNAFESGDQRKVNWIDSLTAAGVTYYFPFKYKQNTYTGTEYTMVLRLAEQYLIRAEAEAYEGKTSNALTDLNTIRTRAGLPNYAGAQDQTSLLTAILHERQVELFTEWGHRWFDMQRTGIINLVMGSPDNVCQSKGGTWNSDGHQALFPIPIADIKTDINLKQTPGY